MNTLGFFSAVADFVPVINVVTDIVKSVGSGGEAPAWWAFALKGVESIAFLQFTMPWFEKITMRTANTWDDHLLAKIKMVLAFALELVAAAGALDPQFARRVAAITGKRKTRP